MSRCTEEYKEHPENITGSWRLLGGHPGFSIRRGKGGGALRFDQYSEGAPIFPQIPIIYKKKKKELSTILVG